MSSRIVYASIVFTLMCILIFAARPSMLFDKDDKIRQFGTETCFSVGVITTVAAIISYYAFAVIDLSNANIRKKIDI